VSIEITEIKIVPAERKRVVAYVTITLDHSLVIHGLKILRGPTGYSVTMPREKIDDSYLEIVSVINTKTRRMLEERVIAEYKKMTGKTVPAGKVNH
jgi:stage V sporulation protein G